MTKFVGSFYPYFYRLKSLILFCLRPIHTYPYWSLNFINGMELAKIWRVLCNNHTLFYLRLIMDAYAIKQTMKQ